MAIDIICDSCGKKIKYGVELVYYITVRTDSSDVKIYDFCEDCYRVYVKPMFKKGENDENPNS